MIVSPDVIQQNLARIRERVAAAAERAGRHPGEVTIVAVTKSVGRDEIQVLYELGIRHFGENRVEQAATRIPELDLPCAIWHMIGSVQRRKARDVVRLFDRVDSVDRVELAEELDRRALGRAERLPVLLEVNVSGEASKHGFAVDALSESMARIATLAHIRVEGLMTMAPLVCDPEEARPVFRRLHQLAAEFGLPETSMGMSNDFEVGVEEGATEIRVGTILFEGPTSVS